MKIKDDHTSHIRGDCSQIKFHMGASGFNEISGTTNKQSLHEDNNLECNWHIQKASAVKYHEHRQRVKEEPNKIHLSFSLGNFEDMYISIILPDKLFDKAYQLLKDSFLSNDIEYAIDFVNFEKTDIFIVDKHKNSKIFSGDNYFSLSIGRQIEERWIM